MNSNFIDYVKIFCRSGKGGAGSAHLRREKFIPKGGPDGGDGGRGGHIIARGNKQMWTLLHLRYTKHVMAASGTAGSKQQRTGAFGKDVYIDVPLGTVIKDALTNEVLAEIMDDEQECVLLQGGRGGLGNTHFKSSTRQTPRFSQPGEPGIEMQLVFELKVLADVGLVGFPNAGKSTLLTVVSAAKPEIADYPFTTLVPNLGIVAYRDQRSFIMADIPGIIEGAHLGKGLGHRFLRHIERNAVLLFMISAESTDIQGEFHVLQNELRQYNPELLDKQYVIAITKCDLLTDTDLKKLKKSLQKSFGDIQMVTISSHTGLGIMTLKDQLWIAMNEKTMMT